MFFIFTNFFVYHHEKEKRKEKYKKNMEEKETTEVTSISISNQTESITSPSIPPEVNNSTATASKLDGEIENLCLMFPGIDRGVIRTVLETNRSHLQKTIDSLLMLSDDTPTTTATTPTSTTTDPSPETPEQTTPKPSTPEISKRMQERDDEILARSLQAQLREGDSNDNDENLAKEIARMEKDEIIARALQQRETEVAERILYQYPVRRRRKKNSGFFDFSDSSDESKEEKPKPESPPGEPIMETIEKKMSEFTEDFKSKLNSLTESISNAFSSPRQEPAYPQNKRKEDDKDLISSSEDDENVGDDIPLLDRRTEKKSKNSAVELTINTE
jgi:hypothetical protein